MTRELTTEFASEIQLAVIRPVLLFHGEFEGGDVRAWNGIGDLVWNAETFLGVGNLGAIQNIEETADLQAAGVTVAMSGIPSELISLALQSVRQNKPGRIWLGMIDGPTRTLIDSVLAFEGRLDVAEIDEGPTTSVVTLKYENRLIDLERARERRYTHEDQQLDYPGDLGFEYVASLQDKQLNWGKPDKPPAPPPISRLFS